MPNSVLVPLILVMTVVGSYSDRNELIDVFVTILFGVIGYMMKRHNWLIAIFVFLFWPYVKAMVRRATNRWRGLA